MNYLIIVFAILFCTMETKYFGYNWSPQSDEEIICDGISLLLFSLGIWNRTSVRGKEIEC